MVKAAMITPIPSKLMSYWCNHLISPIRVAISPIAPMSGHGLLLNMRNGWFSCVDIN
jgi:hypothetical protein